MFGKYWHSALAVTNDDAAVYQAVNVVGVFNPDGTNDPDVVSSVTGHVFVAKTPEQFTYDDDGNLLSDGRWSYTWDAENRLVAMQTLSGLPTNLPVVRIEFDYDYMSRRARKTVWEWNAASNGWQEVSVSAFLYDGWLLVSEESASGGNITTNFYVWGLDLSGSLQGAGGVGGLLAARLGTNNVVYLYDGNGNVSELTDASTGGVKAHYEYSPFGETLVSEGALAKDNPFRFSTKYCDHDCNLYDFGVRWHSPSIGRFLVRDPMGEIAFRRDVKVGTVSVTTLSEEERAYLASLQKISSEKYSESMASFNKAMQEEALKSLSYTEHNLYLFLSNDAINRFDYLGLGIFDPLPQKPGCDNFRDFNKCATSCCNEHDRCFERHGCRAWWSLPLTGGILPSLLSHCVRCNNAVVACLAKAAINPCCWKK